LLSQGHIVAESLEDYLKRHPEIENKISKGQQQFFYTTDSAEEFNKKAATFFGRAANSNH
jgi:glutamate racemase